MIGTFAFSSVTFFITSFAASIVFAKSDSTSEIKARFEKALKAFSSKDEEATVTMTIIESDGSKKNRELKMKRSSHKSEQKLLARILSPADLKGMTMLSVMEGDAENQWVYFPSSKQTRKVVTSDRSDGGILGSEIKYEDFDPQVVRQTKVKILKSEKCEAKDCDVLEATSTESSSVYSKVQIKIEKPTDTPLEVTYFKGDEKVKIVKFLNYKKVGKVLRPHLISVKNLKTQRGTDVAISDLKINSGVDPSSISVAQIARSW